VKGIIKKLDGDGNGRVDWREFERAFAKPAVATRG
jgi:hypothetical protein